MYSVHADMEARIYYSEREAVEDHGLDLKSVGKFYEQRGFELLLKSTRVIDVKNEYDVAHILPEYLHIYDALSDVDILVINCSSIYFDYFHVNDLLCSTRTT